MSTIDTSSKRYQEYLAMQKEFKKPVGFLACPEAMEFHKFDTIPLSLIAPLSRETHNGVRVKGVDDGSVQQFMHRIQNDMYDPITEDPPCVVPLPRNSPLYKEGYRYRMADGNTRREAHVRLNLSTMFVAIIKFKDARNKTAKFWLYSFMAEKNNPTKTKHHRLPSSDEDKVQQAKILIAESTNVTYESVKELVDNLIDQLGVRTKAHREVVYDAAIRGIQQNNPKIYADIVLPYTKQTRDTHVKQFCKDNGITKDDVLVRNFYKDDDMCSRFDFDQFDRLLREGMEDINSLSSMCIVGTTTNCKDSDEVKETRRLKAKLIPHFIEWVWERYHWLKVKKNRDALMNVSVYWLSQTADDPPVGSIFTVDSKTGSAQHIKKY
jgi:hypothetical protein